MKSSVLLRRYEPADEGSLFALLEREGDEWKDYWLGENRGKYIKALSGSITYLLFEEGDLCGYARCRDDDGYGIYVCDLLVDRGSRGKEYGRLLMEQACHEFPDSAVYVLGDVYPYYEDALGYDIEGKVYRVEMR